MTIYEVLILDKTRANIHTQMLYDSEDDAIEYADIKIHNLLSDGYTLDVGYDGEQELFSEDNTGFKTFIKNADSINESVIEVFIKQHHLFSKRW